MKESERFSFEEMTILQIPEKFTWKIQDLLLYPRCTIMDLNDRETDFN